MPAASRSAGMPSDLDQDRPVHDASTVPVDREEPDWARTLNAEQRAAASHDGTPLLVVAGAGVGKTTVIAARIARLLDEGVAPERIAVLTFSRKASREMLDRAVSLGGATAGAIEGGTFHRL